jgi:hypothetical protein
VNPTIGAVLLVGAPLVCFTVMCVKAIVDIRQDARKAVEQCNFWYTETFRCPEQGKDFRHDDVGRAWCRHHAPPLPAKPNPGSPRLADAGHRDKPTADDRAAQASVPAGPTIAQTVVGIGAPSPIGEADVDVACRYVTRAVPGANLLDVEYLGDVDGHPAAQSPHPPLGRPAPRHPARPRRPGTRLHLPLPARSHRHPPRRHMLTRQPADQRERHP